MRLFVATGGQVTIWIVMGGVDPIPYYDGIGAVRFGVEYEAGLGNMSWTLCTGGESVGTYGAWPLSGSAVGVSWPDSCYHPTGNPDGMTRIGFLAPGVGPSVPGGIRIVEDPSVVSDPSWGVPAVIMNTCPPDHPLRLCRQLLGMAEWGSGQGLNTCGFYCGGVSPTHGATWGQIKALY